MSEEKDTKPLAHGESKALEKEDEVIDQKPKILLLKAVPACGRTRNNFLWPESGPVECPDWKPHNDCGNGLHAWIWDESPTPEGFGLQDDFTFRVVEVEDTPENLVRLEGKVKFRSGLVLGAYASVAEAVLAHGLQHSPSVAGFNGTATAGDGGTATAGSRGTATAGDGGTATAGSRGTATAGSRGTATAGSRGTATAGDGGTATAGDGGTATAGYGGTATAGDGGTATAGDGGKVRGGKGSLLVLLFYKETEGRYVRLIRVAGETKGIRADTWYVISPKGKFVVADEQTP